MIFMDKYQKWLVVSIIFLAIALTFPIVALYLQSASTLQEVERAIPPNWEAANPEPYDPYFGSEIELFIQQREAEQTQLLWLIIIVDAVLIALFAATLMYAIRCRDQCRSFPNPTKRQQY